MDDLINTAKIDAKHSNEDVIAPFSDWVLRYGDKSGNFGGIDTDVICSDDISFVKKYTKDVLEQVADKNGGIAIGTGNSVPAYASVSGYLAMNEAIREFRGDFQ
jgi:uroporphyrinogen decarboxylase